MNKKINFKQILSLKNQGFVAGMALSLVVMILGFSLIKNIKTNQQQASAEQVGGSPESGVKSRISELYDALVAKNYGSDTDNSDLVGNLGTDWGAKWNRIKTAALKPGSGGAGGGSSAPVASGVKRVQAGYFNGGAYSDWSDLSISIQGVDINKSVLIVNKGGGSVINLSRERAGDVKGCISMGIAKLNSNHISVKKEECKEWKQGRYDYDNNQYEYNIKTTPVVSPFSWQVIEYY